MDDPFSSLVKMFSSLLLVLGIILTLAFVVKRFMGSRLGPWRNASLVKVLSTTYLGPKKEIAIVEVGQQYLVLGITPTQISLLTRLEQAPFSEKMPGKRKDSESE